jgi:hypothetical protein
VLSMGRRVVRAPVALEPFALMRLLALA